MGGSDGLPSLIPVSEPSLEKAGDHLRILFAIDLPTYMTESKEVPDFIG
jgi:hypothetical protein